MMRLLLICLSFIASSQASALSSGKGVLNEDRTQILQIERQRIQALLERDWQYIDQLMTADSVHITTDGSMRTKAEYINKIKGSKGQFVVFNADQTTLRFYSDMAVLTGRYHNQKRQDGQLGKVKYGVFTRVYKKIKARWQLISHQATVDQRTELQQKAVD